jgi:hypothetical protein
MKQILFALGLLAAIPSLHAAACIEYEPTHVFLRGELLRKTFPGPPGFESVAAGDQAQTGFYLRLLTPVCMRDGAKDSDNGPRTDVQLIQLLLDKAGYVRLGKKVGTTITVKGTLSAPWNGNHHGDLLMEVDPLETAAVTKAPAR